MKVICKGHKYCEYGFKNINDHYCNHSVPHECNYKGSKDDADCVCSEIYLRKEKLEKIQKNENNL